MIENKKNKGTVTLFVTAILVPVLLFGAFSADMVIINSAGSTAGTAADLGILSLLAGYNRNLYDYYGIMAVSDDAEACADCVFSVMQNSTVSSLSRGLLSAEVQSIGVTPFFSSSPANPVVLENCIKEYMTYRGPLSIGINLLEKFDILKKTDKETLVCSEKLELDIDTSELGTSGKAVYEALGKYHECVCNSVFSSGFSEAEKIISSATSGAVSDSKTENYTEANSDVALLCDTLGGLISALESHVSNLDTAVKEQQKVLELINSLDEGKLKETLLSEYNQNDNFNEVNTVFTLISMSENGLSQLNETVITAEAVSLPADSADSILNESENGQFVSECVEYFKNKYSSDCSAISESDYKSILETAETAISENVSEENPVNFSEADVHACFELIEKLYSVSDVDQVQYADFLATGSLTDETAINDAAMESLESTSGFLTQASEVVTGLGTDILCLEYMLEMFSCASDKKESAQSLAGKTLTVSAFFGYELEYLIYGIDNAGLCKASAVASISALRFALNTIYLYSDPVSRSQADALALVITGFTGVGLPLVKNAIMICWSIAETAADMKKLLDGEAVPVYKTRKTWLLSIEGLINAAEEKAKTADGEEPSNFSESINSLTYKEYLTMFLATAMACDKQAVLSRCAKLIQINMTVLDKNFVITDCWTVASVRIEMTANTLFFGAVPFNQDIINPNEAGDFIAGIGKGKCDYSIERLAVY